MKHTAALLVLILFGSLWLGAIKPDSLVTISGIILDPDLQAIENAYLINYRSLRANATNEKGEFKITLQAGDSLKVHHAAYASNNYQIR